MGQGFEVVQKLFCCHALGGPDVMHGPVQLLMKFREEMRALIVEGNGPVVKEAVVLTFLLLFSSIINMCNNIYLLGSIYK